MNRNALAVLLPIVVSCSVAAQAVDPAPLAGPEVKQVRPDLLEQGLTAGPMMGMSMGQARQLPMRDIRRLLEEMSKDDAPTDLRLTEAQREAIETFTSEHQAALRAYRRKHAETIEPMRIKAGLAPVRIPDDQLSASQRNARTVFYSFMRQGPTDADLQTRVFVELTEAQRQHLNTTIVRLLEERYRERREQQYADELNAEPVDPSTFFNADGTVDLDALPARLRRQLADIDEPQRSNRLRRTLERLAERQAASAEPTPAGREAPAVDTIQIPKID